MENSEKKRSTSGVFLSKLIYGRRNITGGIHSSIQNGTECSGA